MTDTRGQLIDWQKDEEGGFEAWLGPTAGRSAFVGAMRPKITSTEARIYTWRLHGWTWEPHAHATIRPADVRADFRAWLVALPVEIGEPVDLEDWGEPPLEPVAHLALPPDQTGRVRFRR